MTKMLDLVRSSSPYGGSCPNAATRPIAAVPDSAGSWRGARDAASFTASNRRDALLARMNAVAILIALRRYREMVGVEIERASEFGARWWSRRLVEVSEEAGLVRLDK